MVPAVSRKPHPDEDPDLLIRLGEAVRARRFELGLTQGELADRAALARGHVGKLERGQLNAQFVTLHRVARALDVDPVVLFDLGDGPVEPSWRARQSPGAQDT